MTRYTPEQLTDSEWSAIYLPGGLLLGLFRGNAGRHAVRLYGQHMPELSFGELPRIYHYSWGDVPHAESINTCLTVRRISVAEARENRL